MKRYSTLENGKFNLTKETDALSGEEIYFAHVYPDADATTSYREEIGPLSELEGFNTRATKANADAEIANTREMIMKIDADPEAMADYLQFDSVDAVRACAARMWLSLDEKDRPPRPSQTTAAAPAPTSTQPTHTPTSAPMPAKSIEAMQTHAVQNPFSKAIARFKRAEHVEHAVLSSTDRSKNPFANSVARLNAEFEQGHDDKPNAAISKNPFAKAIARAKATVHGE